MAILTLGALGLGGYAGRAEAAPAKYFVVIRAVEESEGVHSKIVPEARALFAAELARHPELTLEAPTELGALVGGDPNAYKNALRAHKLKALEVTLRILEVSGSLEPPKEGKPFRVLKRSIRLSVFGTTLPDKVMAIGGDGDAAIAAEIRKTEEEASEGAKLLSEAAKIAITQAVDMTVTKLNLPAGGSEKKKSKKR